MRLTRRQRYCVVCGEPISSKRYSYCSDACMKEGERLTAINERKIKRQMEEHCKDCVYFKLVIDDQRGEFRPWCNKYHQSTYPQWSGCLYYIQKMIERTDVEQNE